jgi:hypothetical protein
VSRPPTRSGSPPTTSFGTPIGVGLPGLTHEVYRLHGLTATGADVTDGVPASWSPNNTTGPSLGSCGCARSTPHGRWDNYLPRHPDSGRMPHRMRPTPDVHRTPRASVGRAGRLGCPDPQGATSNRCRPSPWQRAVAVASQCPSPTYHRVAASSRLVPRAQYRGRLDRRTTSGSRSLGPAIVCVRLTAAAYAHGLALALPHMP